MPRQAITNFSRGEFGPQLYGRVDVPQYNAGAKEITNFIVQRYGGAAFRPGFRFVGEVDDISKTHRYMPFTYSIDQAYVLVLEDSRMRVLANGGMITDTNLHIESVTQGLTTVLEVLYHDMVVGDRIYVDGVEGMEELNGRFFTVIGVPDADHIEIDLDSGGYEAFVDSDGETRVGAPTPPPAPEAAPPAPPAPPPPPTTGGPGSSDDGGGVGAWIPDQPGKERF